MARKPTTKAPGTEVVDWEAQMAEQARIAAEAQRASGGGGQFFTMQGGVLQFDGKPMPGNRVAAIIIANILENSYYEGAYDPNVPASPVCFAFAQHEDALEPHSAVDNDDYFTRQHDVCQGCPRNEWGSAEVGKGKACKNVQRLALIPCGSFIEKGTARNRTLEFSGVIEDEDHYARQEAAFMKLPVMSVKNFGNYVKQLAGDIGRPPHAVFTEIWVEPDPKSQFKVMFELIDRVPKELLATIMARHSKEQAAIDFPYQPPQEREEAAAPAKTNNKLRGKGKR